jgi:hypothetical protein
LFYTHESVAFAILGALVGTTGAFAIASPATMLKSRTAATVQRAVAMQAGARGTSNLGRGFLNVFDIGTNATKCQSWSSCSSRGVLELGPGATRWVSLIFNAMSSYWELHSSLY